jgi:transcriptional regulator with XRE-family HTH domain
MNKYANENANIFRLLRIARDMTQKEVAEKVGIEPAYVSVLEKGKRSNPSEEVINNYARALSVDKELIVNFSKESADLNSFEKMLLWLLGKICNSEMGDSE